MSFAVMQSRRASVIASRRQCGLSLVELMVGITVGLFVVAAAATLTAGQLGDNRKLLLETQVQQDLRATMDIVTRQLRRAGTLDVMLAQEGLATPAGAGGNKNLFADASPSATPDTTAVVSFYRNSEEQGPYRYAQVGNIIKSEIANGGEQELSDGNALKVIAFTVTPTNVTSVALPCPNQCTDGTTDCWPRVVVRDFAVQITAEAKSDSTIRRTMRSEVRVRNEWIKYSDPASTAPVCP